MQQMGLTDRRNIAALRSETALSRRYLRVLEKWIPIGMAYFNDWDVRPNCGHFLGGCYWYGIETIAGALTFAAAASSPDLDEAAIGCSRDNLKSMSLKALRYLCFTHDTGPEDCVRPAKGWGRPENWGNKWGERGLGFFRESQCGTTVSGMALTALLLGDCVDEETWQMLATLHADYAARFGAMPPRSGVYRNTQMEENGWTSCGLASIENVLPNHPEASKWAATARQWMFSTAAAPQDNKNLSDFDGGRTVKDWTGETFTVLPDFMAENHGMVHPNYTASSVHFLGYLGIIYAAFGQPLPKHARFNRQTIYDQLKRTTDRTGSMHPVQGMDWPYLFPDPGTTTHAAAAVLLNDPDAARLERYALDTLEVRQTSNNGRMFDEEIGKICHDVQDPMIMRESFIASPAYTYLLHRICGDGPKPTPEKDLEKNLRGVWVYPHSGFAFHRHQKGQTSFAWRNCIMALPLNRDGIETVAPASNSFLGSIVVRNRPESHDQISIDVDAHADGFAAALVMDRAQRSVRQQILFAGLSNGNALAFERWIARENVTVTSATQGFLRIINEHFSARKTNCNGYRLIYTPDGEHRFDGFVSADQKSDVIQSYDHPAWVNVDDRLGLVFSSAGETVYHNRHYFPTWWAVADDLTLSRIDKPFRVSKGDTFAPFAALIVPDISHKKMGDLSLHILAHPNAVGLIAGNDLAAANFGSSARLNLPIKRNALPAIPIFPGKTAITDRQIRYTLHLPPGRAALRHAVISIETDGALEISATETGDVFAQNNGQTSVQVRNVTSGKSIRIRIGQTVALA